MMFGNARKRSSKARTAVVTVAVCMLFWMSDRRSDACVYSGYTCPCEWDAEKIRVYLDPSIVSLNPSMTIDEWVLIVNDAINIYREHAGIPLRMYYAGTTATYLGGIWIRPDMNTCDDHSAWTSFGTNLPFYPYEITAASIYMRDRKKFSSVCQTITWNPTLQPQTNTAPFNRDPVTLLVHELGHALGVDHPESYCGEVGVQSVMNGPPVWGRHLSRYDKDSLRLIYGYQTTIGKVHRVTPSGVNYLGDMPTSTDQTFPLPGTATSNLASPLLSLGTIGNTRVYQHSPTAGWSFLATSQATWSPPAVISASREVARIYFLREPGSTTNKELCYVETVTSGLSWGSVICPSFQGSTIKTHRDGVAGTYDLATQSFLVAYTEDGDADCNPTCDTISILRQPGPGATVSTTIVTALAHRSFFPPAIACRNSGSAVDRCVLAYTHPGKMSTMWGYYHPTSWITGEVNSASGVWVPDAGPSQQSNLFSDQTPSLVWSDSDSKFHLATQSRRGEAVFLTVFERTPAATTWTMTSGTVTTLSDTSWSNPTLADAITGVYLYYFSYMQ